MIEQKLSQQVNEWIASDPDPRTREELQSLLAQNAAADLADRFAGQLKFGTAGLRGKLGGGPSRMNRAVVIRTTDGLARHLLRVVDDVTTRGVVIGYDGRRQSDEFAEDAARVLCGHGIPVHWYSQRICTPHLAFSVLDLGCAAGIMITASHNPPAYNGYKLYWGNGAQIIPPQDTDIAASIADSLPANQIARPEMELLEQDGLLRRLHSGPADRYVEQLLKSRLNPNNKSKEMPVVYTAMHGVGHYLFSRVTREAGYKGIHVVLEQAAPDGEFPTVELPNPEEFSALKLSIELAEQVGAELILAHDPDADRLAVCSLKSDGGYYAFSGDEIGTLLGDYLLSELPRNRRMPAKPLVETTVVSSNLLEKLAAARGSNYFETLTGFKWIANKGLELERTEGMQFVFGYEEAIGYTIGQLVRDKDGVSAGLFMLELAATERDHGRSPLDRLTDLYREFGLHRKRMTAFVLEGSAGKQRIADTLAALRADPPTEIAGIPVARIRDYHKQLSLDCASGETSPIDLPQSNVIAFILADGSSVTARPSGTEPKLKCYFEVVLPPSEWSELFEGQRLAENKLDRLADSLFAIAGLTD